MSLEGLGKAFMAAISSVRDARTSDEIVAAFNDYGNSAQGAAADTVNDAANDGSVAETRDMDYGYGVVWHAEPDACLACQALNGERAMDGSDYGPFDGLLTFGDKPLPTDHFDGHPPRHPHCCCRLIPWNGDPELLSAFKRESERRILRGWSRPSESNKARIRAADRLLRRGTNLPKTVKARARLDVATGKFQRGRQFPAKNTVRPRSIKPSPAPRPDASLQRLDAGLSSGVQRAERIGTSAVERVVFNNGTEAIRRSATSASEVMSHRVADVLGAPVARTRVASDGRLYQELVNGELPSVLRAEMLAQAIKRKDAASRIAGMKSVDNRLFGMVNSPEGKRLGLFDYLTGQADRHLTNWIIRDGKPVGIDHDLSFRRVVSPFAEYWSKRGSYTTREINEALEAIRALRPEFQRAGMQSQYDEMIRRALYLRDNGVMDESVLVRTKLGPNNHLK